MSKMWGYARCSTNEDKQDINRQIRELKDAGADEVVFEYEHGDAKVKKNLTGFLSFFQANHRFYQVAIRFCQILSDFRR